MKTAFGYTPEEFKRCIPKIFSYSNPKYYGKILRTSSVDFSSHWPASAQGRLPDCHNYIRIKGTVPPSERFPFAFYLNSGHCAEFGVFDTHDWVTHPLAYAMFRNPSNGEKFPHKPYLEPSEDITVLMKPSKYELGKYYKWFYDMREEDSDAKLKANASLGFMHKKNYNEFRLAHIVAIVLGRAQSKTIDVMNSVGSQYVLHAVVDGVIFNGNYKVGEDNKSFGNLHQEWTNLRTRIMATNRYIVLDDNDKCIKVKHGGYECYEDGSEITEDTIKDFNDFDKWKAKRGV